MKVPICQRLLACCDYVNSGDRIADIGCDHGYLSIFLLLQGIIPSAIASDINEQPLLSAVHNAEKYGVRDRMSFFVCSGAEKIPHDFDTLVCAGMGAETMVSILKAAPWLRSCRYHLVLQCQTKTAILRRYLSETGWEITKETVVPDGRFLYTVLKAEWNPASPRLSPGQWYIPPALLLDNSPVLPAYFRWITLGLAHIVESRKASEGSDLRTALTELKNTAAQYHFDLTKEENL